jgi:CRISPR-associated endonuclease/helicase Cas3
MSQHCITLKSVYSCPAVDIPLVAEQKLPAGWRLAWHQAETLKALNDPEIDVVFNTSMTGDGKSLAAYLQVLLDQGFAIGLYPTNALAQDQSMQLQHYVDVFRPDNETRVNRLSAAELELVAEAAGVRKGVALAQRSSQSEVLITNPDIFHYLHRGAYLTPKDTPDKLWNRIDKDFDLFIFDEFHVFAAPQIVSVLNTMLLIRFTNRHKKFLFLSATPSDAMLHRLALAGFKCSVIDPVGAKKYQFPDTMPEAEQLKAQGWRQVSRSIDLHFVSLEPVSKASETWLAEHQDLILNHFLDAPGTKGAIILNSIASVKRLTPVLRTLFADHGLTVRENTGLTGTQEKAQSLSADLVIGTSTIDVGVDFKINLLLFESADAGSFIQRLGRLGRHDGYTKSNGQAIAFNTFTAYSLVPNFFVERLFAGDDPPLADGGSCDRIAFQTIIREKYRQINDFDGYYKRWGAVQSFSLLRDLKHPNLAQQYEGSLQRFEAGCEQVFDTTMRKVAGRIKGWAKDWQTLSKQTKGNPIAEDARSFRGSSPLLCGLYDLGESEAQDRFKTYDLPGVLSNLAIEMWNETAFMAQLNKTAEQTGIPIAKQRFQYCIGFMKLNVNGYREERLNWQFIYPGDLQPIAEAWRVQVLLGLQIWQPDNPWAGAINRKLSQEALVSYVVNRPVREVRLRLRLPMHFQIYPISDQSSIHDANPPYSVAFGQSALLLDTLAYKFKQDGGEIWVV